MKGLSKLMLIPLFALGLGSCRDFSQDFYKYKEKDNLIMRASMENQGNVLRIKEKDSVKPPYGPSITAIDNFPVYKKNILGDGRFDIIKLDHVPIGHPLEKYANLDSITKLYKEVKETGVAFEAYPKAREKIK